MFFVEKNLTYFFLKIHIIKKHSPYNMNVTVQSNYYHKHCHYLVVLFWHCCKFSSLTILSFQGMDLVLWRVSFHVHVNKNDGSISSLFKFDVVRSLDQQVNIHCIPTLLMGFVVRCPSRFCRCILLAGSKVFYVLNLFRFSCKWAHINSMTMATTKYFCTKNLDM